MKTRKPQPYRRKGSIIVMVLVFIVLLSFIVVAFLQEATARIKYYGLFHNQDDLRTDAYSALEITLGVINQYREIEGVLYGPEQGWGNPLSFVDWQPTHASSIQVTFHNESGRFSLADTTFERFRETFTLLGFDLSTAQSLADSLLDWMDEDDLSRLNGYDADDYEGRVDYRPSNAPITTWDELRLIHGFEEAFWDEEGRPKDIQRQFKEAFSLTYSGPVNINAAPQLVIDVLSEEGLINDYALEDYRNGQDGIRGNADDRLLRPETLSNVVLNDSAEGISAGIEELGISVESIRGEARFLLTARVAWQGSDPSANQFTTEESVESSENGEETTTAESDPNADERRQARGSAQTESGIEADLGYPFQILRLAENQPF